MTNEELDRALRQLRFGGMADTLDVRAQQARAEHLGPSDFIGLLVHDEMNADAIVSSNGVPKPLHSAIAKRSTRSTRS